MQSGIFTGYGIKFRQLTQQDVQLHGVNLAGNPLEECVAIDGEDLGPCLAAVVNLVTHRLVWSDADAQGTPVAPYLQQQFAEAVVLIANTLVPAAAPAQDAPSDAAHHNH